MKLVSFSITNYRSITVAHKIKIDDITILIGKNNEGKSNILKALSVCLNIIGNAYYRTYNFKKDRWFMSVDDVYIWERDFPISLQNRHRGLYTTFKLEFELCESEIIEFRSYVGSRINGSIQIEIKIGKDNKPIISVPKRGTKSFEKKADKIRSFIKNKITFNYIPAIRTEADGIRIIMDNLSKELTIIEDNEEYKKAIITINNLQQEILDGIALKIKNTLISFMPNIRDVKLNISMEARMLGLRRDVDVIIDDGTPTNIERKGDGIKSLVTMGILTDKYNSVGSSIIAIDEPEAHLHPGAIRELNNIIRKLKTNNQVIITTHNPQFVDIDNIKNNIIINEGKAIQCKNIDDIRNILGIKASDNLQNSRYVLVLEGENDKKVISRILKEKSPIIKKAIEDRDLTLQSINGISKLSYTLSLLKSQICEYYVFADNDVEGRNAVIKVIGDKLLSDSNYNLISCEGMKESEFEDCIKTSIYRDIVLQKYGVDLNKNDDINKLNKKWSVRMKNIFEKEGKIWSEIVETDLKRLVSDSVCEYKKEIDDVFIDSRKSSIENMIKGIERLIQ